ncbi:cytochrome P450 [Aaosphaeria arxii CBS 175.79]|uniref:Cytochrome P450 n=1 Tax=Aaosphaeria arxii CBS 175.79 TaxID=1450172 RepID=A0A6A5XUC7_9PLEO|nr:cytochrome P450 [Aaosphaeria arxii CBS 175.79]KAF2016965.1 cytochrome P450 [Aaosphaeria arxii CBS 175.79]
MYHFIASFIAIYFGIVYTFVGQGHSFADALITSTLMAVSFNSSLLSSIVFYRVFLHRCRKFPGPFLAGVSKFYAFYQSAKEVRYYKETEAMHAKYGDFVRVGPRQISIMRKSAVPLIFGPQSNCIKGTFYGNAGNDPTKISINMIRDEARYKLRRRAWDRGLSMKAIGNYEPRITEKVNLLLAQMRRNNGTPMDVTKWSMMLSFDIMGSVGFSKDFDNLKTGKLHPATHAIHDHLTHIGTIGETPWLLNILSSIPGAAAGFASFFNFCAREMEAKQNNWNSDAQPQDIASWLIKAVKDKDISASPTKESLTDDSRVIIIAGSDTFANVLACTLFYLAKDKDVQSKVRRLIDEALPDGPASWSYDKIRKVTYIDDIVNETLRLKPPVISQPHRQTPARGLQIDEQYIPGNVNVTVPPILIMRDERWWKQPFEFIPERFGSRREEMGTDDAPYMPFGLGVHTCPGNNLAYANLRISISSIVQNFDIDFAPGETGEAFDKDFLDTPLIKLPPLYLEFKARKPVNTSTQQ